jgi:RNA polymerase sigma factor (TIGR02999 family)
VTGFLLAWREGDPSALDQLMPLVYAELHRLAHRHMRSQTPGHPLQTTALVHEAYLRLIGSSRVGWQNRTHFFAVSAQLMRRVLVDAVRARLAQKRGGGAVLVSLGDSDPTGSAHPDLIALNDALDALAQFDPRKARVVELRYFGGLTVEETAEALDVSVSTVERDWQMARLWLSKTLRGLS